MTTLTQRGQIITMVSEAIAADARLDLACAAIGLSERTLQRWQNAQARADQRPTRVQTPKNKLSQNEREQVLATANAEEFGHLAPSQIVPRLADQGRYIACESTFYRVLKAAHQSAHRGTERPRKKRSKPRVRCVPPPPTSCSVGTSPICPRWSPESISTCTFFWTFLAEKSWAGRFMSPRAASSLQR